MTEAQRLAQLAYNALCTAAGDMIRAQQAIDPKDKHGDAVLSEAYSLAVNARIELTKFSHPEASAIYRETLASIEDKELR